MSTGFMFFIQLVVSGIAVGCLYALIAVGFVLILKATDILNFAQGEVIMNHRLADIQDIDPVTGQHIGKSSGKTGMVFAGDVQQNYFAHKGLFRILNTG